MLSICKKYITLTSLICVLITNNTRAGNYHNFSQEQTTIKKQEKKTNTRNLLCTGLGAFLGGVFITFFCLRNNKSIDQFEQDYQKLQQENRQLKQHNKNQVEQHKQKVNKLIEEQKNQKKITDNFQKKIERKIKKLQDLNLVNEKLKEENEELNEVNEVNEELNEENQYLNEVNQELNKKNQYLKEVNEKLKKENKVNEPSFETIEKAVKKIGQVFDFQLGETRSNMLPSPLKNQNQNIEIEKGYKKTKIDTYKLNIQRPISPEATSAQLLEEQNLESSIEIVPSPRKITDLSNSIVECPAPYELEHTQKKEACRQLYEWMYSKDIKSKNTEWVMSQIVKACCSYAGQIGQICSEGTFCLKNPPSSLTNYINKNLNSRRSTHLPDLAKETHKGWNFEAPIRMGAKNKRTVLAFTYQTIGGEKMLFIKPENAEVISRQHLLEYLVPPTGSTLKNRKERILPIEHLPKGKKISENPEFNEDKYKMYGISYLHKNNYFGQSKAIQQYLEKNKLDYPGIRIGEEIIITKERLEKILNKNTSHSSLNSEHENKNSDSDFVVVENLI